MCVEGHVVWVRGVRVGEASHPGPRRRRRVRYRVESSWSGPDRTLLDDFARDPLLLMLLGQWAHKSTRHQTMSS